MSAFIEEGWARAWFGYWSTVEPMPLQQGVRHVCITSHLFHAGVWGKAHPRAALRRRGGQLRVTAGAPAALALGEHHSLGSIIYNVNG